MRDGCVGGGKGRGDVDLCDGVGVCRRRGVVVIIVMDGRTGAKRHNYGSV